MSAAVKPSQVRRAVVLAAGMATRLAHVDVPKPLVGIGGLPILHRTLRALAAVGVRHAVIVVGHRAAEIVASVGDSFADITITYLHSDRYRETNNAFSLWLAREHLTEDIFLIEGDVAFDPELLSRLTVEPEPAVLAVAPWRPEFDGTVAAVDDGAVSELILKQRQRPGLSLTSTFKTVNVSLLRAEYLEGEFRSRLDTLIDDGGENAFYESVLADTVAAGRRRVRAVDCGDLRWYEVDNSVDLARAEYAFAGPRQRLAQLDGQHGGYWRHDVVDHRMLDNPWFPPPQMISAMASEFGDALRHYPPGQSAFGVLLSAVVNQPVERLAVANGAAELIKVLGRLVRRVVLTVPNFNEYEQVLGGGRSRRFELAAPDFALDVDALARAAWPDADAVVVTSPNNPTSLMVPREDLLRLAKRLRSTGTRLLVDESFVDFSEQGASVTEDLVDHPNLVVVKSMSKAYGIGGLRLGYLATADLRFAAAVRAELPIWNINGIAESFLRLLPRHTADFAASLDRVRAATGGLYDALRALGLVAVPPAGNFVLVRLPEPWTGPAVASELFERHRLLVKDCAGKSMIDGDRYLRLASRTKDENARLVTALAAVLAKEPM